MNQPVSPDGVFPSVCPLDCADTCSLSVTRRDGKVVAVRGSSANPFTRGKICAKVAQAMPRQVHGHGRLRQPMVLDGPPGSGAYRPVTWDEALDIVYQQFREIIDAYGAQAIAPLTYGGPMGLLAGRSMDRRFFNRLGASQVDSSPLCAGVSSAAWDSVFGDVGGTPYAEIGEAALIVIWGNNITACNLHLTTLIRDARKRGAKVVVVDPRRTRIADDADLHLPLLPGTDVVLAYAVATLIAEQGGLDHAFIDEHVHGAEAFLAEAAYYTPERAAQLCGLSTASIAQFARWWCDIAPAIISVGVGPERNRNGGSGLRAMMALPALTGNLGSSGAGICDVSGFFPVADEALACPQLRCGDSREFNVLDLPRHILDPGSELPIKGLFIYNHNPVAVHPRAAEMRQALLSEDVFVVGSDISMTDSMACCDLILPAASHLEYGDLYKAYGHHYLQRTAAVIAPVGEAVSNMELFRRLAVRFGFADPALRDTDEQLMDQALFTDGEVLGGRRPSQLDAGEVVDMSAQQGAVMFRDALPATPSGKVELFSATLEAQCGQGLPAFRPLQQPRAFILISAASEKRINSTFGGIDGQRDDLVCEMHPRDAAERSLNEGESVRLYNDQGHVELPLKFSERQRPGTVFVPKGAWLRESASGQTVNALIPGHKADIAGGACYYDCTVDIEPCA
ncbi:molybdopterin-containing oxidoreductase family protein [Pseudohalioglobus lutimaris]|uniref:Oxidoreductase n=1 Tax=Pseudohalioglobus lutimaris TaxID=1737061 RepID=A0A2N5X6Q7_9GAMM|nr:molybdopterin-dependent oxidoreductase [Pseudohalioglobus lutimaris]PLW70175.1 oxidoreductase [Pseudohalioglobus lutimaris]